MSLNGTALSIEGGPDLERALAGLANEISDKVARKAARAGAVVIKDAIKDNVPLGPGNPKIRHTKDGERVVTDYGHGRDNIKVFQPSGKTKALFTNKGYFEFQITRGDAFWLDFREHGTVHQRAQPMFRPGFDSAAPRAADTVGAVLKAGIERFAGK